MKKELNFGQALEAAKLGRCIAREGWNGKRMFVFMRPEFKCELEHFEKIKSIPDEARERIITDIVSDRFGAGWSFDFLPYLCMWSADGKIVNGWLASQTDMLSKDWCIL